MYSYVMCLVFTIFTYIRNNRQTDTITNIEITNFDYLLLCPSTQLLSQYIKVSYAKMFGFLGFHLTVIDIRP